MKFTGFCGPTYQSVSPNIDAELSINLYCEQSESRGAKTPIAMLRAPGKKVFTNLPEGSSPGIFTLNGRSFVAASHLWEIGSSNTDLGDLGVVPTGPTQIIANETQLLVLNNGNLFTYDLTSNTFAAVNMTQLDGPVLQIDFIDGFGIAVLKDSHEFQVSNLEDFTTWSGLNKSKISYFPDNIVSMKVDHRELWFWSGKKAVGYYNVGAGFPPFIPIQGAFIEDGAGATWATVQMDNTLYWLSRNDRGSLEAKKLVGYVGQRVSTHAVEEAWQQYAHTDDAVGYSYQENGHEFWVLRFPSANTTWVLDAATGYWHQRGFWNKISGTFSADRSTCHTENFGKHLIGDWSSGNIYELNSAFNDDAGEPIRWVRRSPTIAKENEWLYFSALEVDVEVGLGPMPPFFTVDSNGNHIPRPPQMNLRWSNDAAKTWSNTFLINCGQAGKFNARARRVMLGRGRKRVFELSATDPIPWRIADAFVTAEPQSA